jgi:hypothetical protein
MVRMFVMAAAVVTGQPVVTGDHDTLTDLSKDPSRDPSSSQMDAPPKPAWDESSKLSSTVEAD